MIKRINPFDLVLLNQKLDNAVESLSDSFIENILQEKLNELLSQMNLIIKNNPDEKGLHRIRILLRELVYTLSIIKKGRSKLQLDLTLIY